MPSKAIARYWIVMGVKYGQKWSSQFPDEFTLNLARDEWAKELAVLTMEQIAKGLDVVTTKHPSWPPTIGEFKQLCFEQVSSDYPSIEKIWMEILSEQPYKNGIALAIAKDERVMTFEWRLLQMNKVIPLLAPIYQDYIVRASNGDEFNLPEKREALEDKTGKYVTKEERKKASVKGFADIRKAMKC